MSPGIDYASLCSLACRYDNPIPTQFLVPIDCSKIPKLEVRGDLFLLSSLSPYIVLKFQNWKRGGT